MKTKNATIVADEAVDRDIVEFRQAWKESCGAYGPCEEPCGAYEDLQARLRFETLIDDLSLKFINLPGNEVDAEIEDAQRRVCQFLDLDMSSLWQWSHKSPESLVLTHLYRSLEGPPTPEPMDAQEYFPWSVRQLQAGKVIYVSSIEDLPAEAARDQEVCRYFNIKSALALPLSVGRGPLIGVLSFNDVKDERVWSEALVKRLQLVAQIFASTLVRNRSDEAIRAALAENEQLRERLERENVYLREQIILKHQHGRIIGKSRALKKVLSEAERVASADTPVLLLGETGTGKELLAQTIHELSPRRDRPMVVVNCASLPATLIESELFGREAGAYTGAASAQIGRFAIADSSTLFLDEIGEFPIELQAKLLRVLQDGRFERLGSPASVTVNVRIIAATNRDLEQAMRDGNFRADLYHRLNVFPIHVPALRERREDVPLLVWAFVEVFSRRMGKTINSIPRRTMEQFQQYSWPGNVRELSNVIERAMILTTGDSLLVEMPGLSLGSQRSRMTLNEGMREQILRVLQDTGWRIRGAGGAAEILAIKPTTLESRMAKLGINRKRGISDIS
ncbi:MAG: sigma 54-interacting transcriptional regulator [Thermoguttaceae bacterium]